MKELHRNRVSKSVQRFLFSQLSNLSAHGDRLRSVFSCQILQSYSAQRRPYCALCWILRMMPKLMSHRAWHRVTLKNLKKLTEVAKVGEIRLQRINIPFRREHTLSSLSLHCQTEKIQKFRIQFLQGQVNMTEIVEEYSIIIYNIYIIYNNTTISQSGVWQP